jgi:hypothetical protein
MRRITELAGGLQRVFFGRATLAQRASRFGASGWACEARVGGLWFLAALPVSVGLFLCMCFVLRGALNQAKLPRATETK